MACFGAPVAGSCTALLLVNKGNNVWRFAVSFERKTSKVRCREFPIAACHWSEAVNFTTRLAKSSNQSRILSFFVRRDNCIWHGWDSHRGENRTALTAISAQEKKWSKKFNSYYYWASLWEEYAGQRKLWSIGVSWSSWWAHDHRHHVASCRCGECWPTLMSSTTIPPVVYHLVAWCRMFLYFFGCCWKSFWKQPQGPLSGRVVWSNLFIEGTGWGEYRLDGWCGAVRAFQMCAEIGVLVASGRWGQEPWYPLERHCGKQYRNCKKWY